MKNLILITVTTFIISCSSSTTKIKENDIIYGILAIDDHSFTAENEDRSQSFKILIHGILPHEENLEVPAKEYLDELVKDKMLIIKKIYTQDKLNKTITADVWDYKNPSEKESFSDKQNLNIAIKLLAYGMVLYDKNSQHEQSDDYINAQILGNQVNRSRKNEKSYKEAVEKGIKSN